MHHICLFGLFILLALICGAFFSYPVYILLHPSTGVSINKLIAPISSLSGFLFLLQYLKFRNVLSRNVAGFQSNQVSVFHDIFNGLFAGIIIMLILILILLSLGTHKPEPEFDYDLSSILLIFFKSLLTGLMVALIEETLYRGAIFGYLQKFSGILPAIIISSVVYSAVHFIKIPVTPTNTEIVWYTGFILFIDAFYRFSDPGILDAFLTLFVFGVLLSFIRLHKGNIFQCIGLHAGVVMTIKIINDLTDYNPENNYIFLVNKYDHLLGNLATIWLILLTFFYFKIILKYLPESGKTQK